MGLLQREVSGLFHPLDPNSIGVTGAGAGGGGGGVNGQIYLNSNNSSNNSSSGSSSGHGLSSSNQPHNLNIVGDTEWTAARDVECLLFMLASLSENICEMPSPPSSSSSSSSIPSYSTLLPSLPVSPYPLGSARLGPNTPHMLQPASSKLSTYRPSQTENLDSDHPCRTWFRDIAAVTVQILEQMDETKRDYILGKYPAVGCRLLQLWLALPTPPGETRGLSL